MWNKISAVGADKASRNYLMWIKSNLLYEDCHLQPDGTHYAHDKGLSTFSLILACLWNTEAVTPTDKIKIWDVAILFSTHSVHK